MKRRVFIFVGALTAASSLAACGKAEDRTVSLERRAQNAFSNAVLDPNSIQLRKLREGKSGSICGEVNAKNAFGGYVGFRRFYADFGASAASEQSENTSGWMNHYAKICGGDAEQSEAADVMRREREEIERSIKMNEAKYKLLQREYELLSQ